MEEVWSEREVLENARDGVLLVATDVDVDAVVLASMGLSSEAMSAARTSGVRDSQIWETDFGTTVSDVALLLCVLMDELEM